MNAWASRRKPSRMIAADGEVGRAAVRLSASMLRREIQQQQRRLPEKSTWPRHMLRQLMEQRMPLALRKIRGGLAGAA